MATATATRGVKQSKPLPAPNSDFYEVYETLSAERDGEAGARVHGVQGSARHHEVLGGRRHSAALAANGIEVVAQLTCEAVPNPHSFAYLRTKKEKMGHALSLLQGDGRQFAKSALQTNRTRAELNEILALWPSNQSGAIEAGP
jgi:hypothetical protein